MVRVGTLLDEFGRPQDKVQIVRRGKINTRIKRSTNPDSSREVRRQGR